MNKFMVVLSAGAVLCVLAVVGPGEANGLFSGGTACNTPGGYNKQCPSASGKTCPSSRTHRKCKSSTSNDSSICGSGEGAVKCSDSRCTNTNQDSLDTPCDKHE